MNVLKYIVILIFFCFTGKLSTAQGQHKKWNKKALDKKFASTALTLTKKRKYSKSLVDKGNDLVLLNKVKNNNVEKGKNNVFIWTPTMAYRNDLAGVDHANVPTPHMLPYKRNFINGKDAPKRASRSMSSVIPMTHKDLRTVFNFLRRKK